MVRDPGNGRGSGDTYGGYGIMAGPWIGWNGGECPVHPETIVEWVTYDGAGAGAAGVGY